MKYISIFCGSASGFDSIYQEQAYQLGKELVARGYGLVYGGARVGLMGAVADGVLDNGGKVIGIIPKFLQSKELEYVGLTELHVVETMHERKAMMNEKSDGIIALPGGYGTMEELFEMLTWAQLSLHKKAVSILNTKGYYNDLLSLSDTMIKNGFLKEDYRHLLIVDDQIKPLLDKIDNYKAPKNDKWFEPLK